MRENTDSTASTPGFERDKPPSKRRLMPLLMVLAVIGLLFVGTVGPATAQTLSNNSTYYDNASANASSVGSAGWFGSGDATLPEIVGFVVRIPTEIIGIGGPDQSGTGFQGFMLTGLLMSGAALSAIFGAGLSPIGGTITAFTMGTALTSVGYAPRWLLPVMLFGLGILLTLAIRRAIQT